LNITKNAKTTPGMRALIAGRRQAGETPGRIAGAIRVAEVTVRKWIARDSAARAGGSGGPLQPPAPDATASDR